MSHKHFFFEFDKVEEIFLKGFHKIDTEEAYKLTQELLKGVLYKGLYFLNQKLAMIREYESKFRETIIINYFHSLYIAYISSYLAKNKINPYQDINSFNKKNYPNFAVFLFSPFRVKATLDAADAYLKYIEKEEINFDGTLKKEGILIITKMFSEKFLHNINQMNKLEDILNNIKKIENGEIDLKDF